MAPAPSTSSPEGRFQTGARFLGIFNVVLSLALAALLAVGIADIAHQSLATGLLVVGWVLAARWLQGTLTVEWGTSTRRSVKSGWRRQTVGHLSVPRREGERSRGDLDLAIDHAADGPSLELLSISARASVLGLVVVFWSVGWLATAITLALMALAVPLYQRAGRRSEVLAGEYQQRRALLEGRQLELLGHAPELRALGAVEYGADEIAAISNSENVIAMRAIRVALESSLVTEFLSGVSIGLVAMVVGFALLEGRVSLLRALIAVLVTSEIFVTIRRFGTEFHRREDAQRSMALLLSGAVTRAKGGGPLLSATDLVTEASPRPLSFTVQGGDRVLVTGPSGSGKSTLLATLVGWRDALAGVASRGPGTIGFVSSESALFSGSLWENLTLGRDLASTEVRRTLDDLGLTGDRFADLDAALLADGRGLSNGERVRLVLARALLADIDLLVLDDVAGVMDAMTRDKVRARLERESFAIVEASVDSPLMASASTRIELNDER